MWEKLKQALASTKYSIEILEEEQTIFVNINNYLMNIFCSGLYIVVQNPYFAEIDDLYFTVLEVEKMIGANREETTLNESDYYLDDFVNQGFLFLQIFMKVEEENITTDWLETILLRHGPILHAVMLHKIRQIDEMNALKICRDIQEYNKKEYNVRRTTDKLN
jgi:hypothetical protein